MIKNNNKNSNNNYIKSKGKKSDQESFKKWKKNNKLEIKEKGI